MLTLFTANHHLLAQYVKIPTSHTINFLSSPIFSTIINYNIMFHSHLLISATFRLLSNSLINLLDLFHIELTSIEEPTFILYERPLKVLIPIYSYLCIYDATIFLSNINIHNWLTKITYSFFKFFSDSNSGFSVNIVLTTAICA